MVQINNINITTKKGREIVKKLSLVLNEGDKLAIIGEEGNGKSTIAKAIIFPERVSQYANITGQIQTNGAVIGYLEQILDKDWYDQEIYRYFLKTFFSSITLFTI